MKKQLCIIISAMICTSAVIPAVSHAGDDPWKFSSTFIQNWYCRDWTEKRWEQEFNAAKSAGFDSLILQSAYDIARGDCTGDKHDYSAYPSAESFCMYQSDVPATYHSSQNSGDALELALKAAKATDMQLWLGTVSDDMWWNYGWGAPSSYFEEWSNSNSKLSSGLIDEIWSRYGTDYNDQIAGWYYTNEIWNIDAACDGSDRGEYARIIGENIKASVTAIKRDCPGKPLIISPFYNTDLSTSEQFGSFIGDIIASSGLRPIDIYAPQDGGGREYSPEIIRKWTATQKKAVDGHMRFWINNECFGKESAAKPVEQLRENYIATADLAENNILFSWNHYYASDSALNSQFKAFAAGTVTGDVNSDGELNIADVVLLQKWLLNAPGAELSDWKAADINSDGRLNVFDLILLKRRYINADTEPYLVWCDEFDGSSLDMSKWSYELGNWKLDADGNYVTNGWGNNEQEFYTDSNAEVRSGVLTISARKEHYTDPVQGEYEYTSARLSTQHRFSTCGGRIEVRARCDSGKSLWPTIWMLPEDSLYGGWAASGEIDIMEGWGSTPEKICGTIHFGGQWPDNTYLTHDYNFTEGDSTENWHTYAVEWESGEIRWYVDDVLYSTQSDWYSKDHAYPAPFDQHFYIILNLAVGGHFDGIDGIYADPSVFENGDKKFEIDYVRVYDLNNGFVPTEVTSLPLESYIEGADAALSNKDGATEITVNSVGELEYAVMGLIRGNKVNADEKHTLSFDASSSAEREMIVTAEDSTYTRYIDEKLILTADEKHYSFDVTFSEDMNIDLKFQLGNIGDAAGIGAHKVILRNIKWE